VWWRSEVKFNSNGAHLKVAATKAKSNGNGTKVKNGATTFGRGAVLLVGLGSCLGGKALATCVVVAASVVVAAAAVV
jgi:hypothetical protein